MLERLLGCKLKTLAHDPSEVDFSLQKDQNNHFSNLITGFLETWMSPRQSRSNIQAKQYKAEKNEAKIKGRTPKT